MVTDTASTNPGTVDAGTRVTPIRVPVALFNYQNGGRQVGGGYDFGPLQHAFASVDEPSALILFCEAKGYRDDGGTAKYAAAEALSDELGVPYVAELGSMPRGPMPPAIFYNPDQLVPRRWWQPDDPNAFEDQANVATFALRHSGPHTRTRTVFQAFVHHFEPLSGDVREFAARRLGRYGDTHQIPVIGGGDLNGTASGPHLPQRDWLAARWHARTHKGVETGGVWGPDTRAVDYLIGRWDEPGRTRIGGSGFHALTELAWRATPEPPIVPTVNDNVDAGGGLLIDYSSTTSCSRASSPAATGCTCPNPAGPIRPITASSPPPSTNESTHAPATPAPRWRHGRTERGISRSGHDADHAYVSPDAPAVPPQ